MDRRSHRDDDGNPPRGRVSVRERGGLIVRIDILGAMRYTAGAQGLDGQGRAMPGGVFLSVGISDVATEDGGGTESVSATNQYKWAISC